MNWNDLIGCQFNGYTILAELGRGGSSRVYRASHAAHERDVAIKVIPNDAEDRSSFVNRFDREVKAIERLNHPNIVAIYDWDKTSDFVYLVMRYITGGTLRKVLGHQLPQEQAAHYMVQMALALHHAHGQGIVHRDVKPSNMLLDGERDGHVLLTDFGTAKIQGALGLTKTGMTIGTPEYMSPEQAEGRETDARADIYALGCVLYEALCGRPPFFGAKPLSIMFQQVHARPPLIRSLNSQVPHELAHIVEIALAKRPEDRFRSAEQFAQHLLPFLGNAPAAALARSDLTHMSTVPPEQLEARGFSLAPVVSADARLDRQALFAPEPPEAGERADGHPDLPVAPGEPPTIVQLRTPPASGRLAPAPDDRPPEDWRPTLPRHTTRPLISSQPLRLPSKGPSPAEQSLSAAGELALEAFMAQTEQRGSDSVNGWPRAGLGTVDRGAGGWLSVENLETQPPVATRHRSHGARRRRLLLPAAVLLGLVALTAVGWLGIAAAHLGITPSNLGGAPVARITATTRATRVPTATVTALPTAQVSATPNPAQALDREAAASFTAVTLAHFQDGACAAANGTSQFASGQDIYINLCTSRNVARGPMTVAIVQGGAVIFTMASGDNLAPDTWQFFYSSKTLAPGTYAALVTIQINGTAAVARNLAFTVR